MELVVVGSFDGFEYMNFFFLDSFYRKKRDLESYHRCT